MAWVVLVKALWSLTGGGGGCEGCGGVAFG